jgi:hypothetical protein
MTLNIMGRPVWLPAGVYISDMPVRTPSRSDSAGHCRETTKEKE